MTYCDCGDYCGWCQPEMCETCGEQPTLEQLKHVRNALRDIRRGMKRIEGEL